MNDQNAMTEVALGLAMAFFAIFVLVLVSLGTPNNAEVITTVEDLALVHSSEGRALNAEETFLIAYQGRVMDQRLQPVSLDNIKGPIVLGVMPNEPIERLLDLQNQHPQDLLAITMLDQQWQQRLKSLDTP
jgi:hypothetical protein